MGATKTAYCGKSSARNLTRLMCFFPTPRRLNYSSWEHAKKNAKNRTGITLVLSRLSIFHMFQVVVVVQNPFQKQTKWMKNNIFLPKFKIHAGVFDTTYTETTWSQFLHFFCFPPETLRNRNVLLQPEQDLQQLLTFLRGKNYLARVAQTFL